MARRYYQALQERLSKYGLEIEPSKSRLLEYGRYAKERRKRRGLGKPETFDFLGFVKYHYYVVKMLFKWLNRRSHKGSYTWEQFHMMQTHYPIAYPKRYVNLYE